MVSGSFQVPRRLRHFFNTKHNNTDTYNTANCCCFHQTACIISFQQSMHQSHSRSWSDMVYLSSIIQAINSHDAITNCEIKPFTAALVLGPQGWEWYICLAVVNFMYWSLHRQALRKLLITTFISTCFVFSAPVSCFSCHYYTLS